MLYATDGGELGYQGQEWNKLCEIWEWAQTSYGLTDGDGAVAAAFEAGEGAYYEELHVATPERDSSEAAPTRFLDYAGTIKWLIIDRFNGLKQAEDEAQNLDWGDIVGHVQGLDPNQLFTNIVANHGDLSGGHGTGWSWWMGDKANTEISSGSVPDNTHGTSEGALGGARGAVRTAISGFNGCIDGVVQSITWPLGY